jgi:hypothetical protein
MTQDDIKQLNQETLQACSVSDVAFVYADAAPVSAAWDHPDFAYPTWWRSGEDEPARARAAVTAGAGSLSPERFDRDEDLDRETVVAKADPSPHLGGRAQPGDVIGIEEGGERTHIGETAEDENRRREDAERAAGGERERRDND